MKIIIWLWNPWKEYEITRHNIGFLFVDYLAKKYKFPDFTYESKFKADISKGIIDGESVILVKPQTFMNLSGESVSKINTFFKIAPDDFIVVYDDISMDFGKIRFRDTGSAGWHNGIKDIIRFYKEKFNRVKFWVGYDSKWDVSDWVLWKFSAENLIELENKYFEKIYEVVQKNIL